MDSTSLGLLADARMLVLRLTSPGIPDHYNGHELPSLRSSTTTAGVWSTGRAVQTMLGSTGVEIPKLHVIRQALALRARRPEAVGSAYQPPPPTESTCAYRAATSPGWTC